MKKTFVLLIMSVVSLVSNDMIAMTAWEKSSCLPQTALRTTDDGVALTAEDMQAVKDKAAAVSPEIRQKFDKALTAWRQAIEGNARMRMSSSTYSYMELPESEVLRSMGGEIIPLIMEKLLTRDNFYLLPLYEAMQTDKKLVPKVAGSEQERAVLAVRLWLDAGKA